MATRRSLPYLNAPNELRPLFKALWDQIELVQGATDAPALKGALNTGGYNLQNLADAVNPTDAVTLQQLEAAVNPTKLAATLSSGGAAPLNVTNLIGAGGNLIAGTHAQRLATPAVEGNFFFEYDRTWLYGANQNGVWQYLGGIYLSSATDRPADLGNADLGAVFQQHDYANGNLQWWWTGANWYADGVQRGAIASLPAASNALAGSYYEATDYDRVYLCTGAAWVDAPGEPTRGQVGLFTADPGTGWQVCDGSTVTRSTSAGGTTSVTVPNLTVGYIAGFGATATTDTIGTSGTFYNLHYMIPYYRL